MRRVASVLLGLMVLAFAGSVCGIVIFKNHVQVSPFADGDNWFLTQPLEYEIRDTGVVVTVPAGFVTDFASIPRPFWSVLPRWGKYGAPAVVHDYLYWDQRCTRKQADRMLLVAMNETDVGGFWRFIIHRAVSWGGHLAWRGNADLRASGRTREIPDGRSPTDPALSWAEIQQALFAAGHRPHSRPSPDSPPDYCAEIESIPMPDAH